LMNKSHFNCRGGGGLFGFNLSSANNDHIKMGSIVSRLAPVFSTYQSVKFIQVKDW
jgi:hypothetical protein